MCFSLSHHHQSAEPRINFALNYGTKSSPKCRIYHPLTVFDQLEKATRNFLADNVILDTKANKVSSFVELLLCFYLRSSCFSRSCCLECSSGMVQISAMERRALQLPRWPNHLRNTCPKTVNHVIRLRWLVSTGCLLMCIPSSHILMTDRSSSFFVFSGIQGIRSCFLLLFVSLHAGFRWHEQCIVATPALFIFVYVLFFCTQNGAIFLISTTPNLLHCNRLQWLHSNKPPSYKNLCSSNDV